MYVEGDDDLGLQGGCMVVNQQLGMILIIIRII